MRELTEASKEAAAAAVAAETEDATGIESSPPSSAEGLEDGEQDQNTSGRQAVVGETTAMVMLALLAAPISNHSLVALAAGGVTGWRQQ